MNYNDDDDDRYITKDEAIPEENRYDWGMANNQKFACPSCGSYNTTQQVEFELCNSCGWHQSY